MPLNNKKRKTRSSYKNVMMKGIKSFKETTILLTKKKIQRKSPSKKPQTTSNKSNRFNKVKTYMKKNKQKKIYKQI